MDSPHNLWNLSGTTPPQQSTNLNEFDFLSILSKQLNPIAAPNQPISVQPIAQQINQRQGVPPPVSEESSLFPPTNTNRGLAKSERHVRDSSRRRQLEDKVVALEQKSSAQATENGNLRELLGRLQDENLMHAPRSTTTLTVSRRFTTGPVDLSRFVRKQGDVAHSLAGFSDV
ncbi:hypothetical protein FRC04_006105 [Tulasnella sp. 424]|nr:hypothetical protein FRC04_006105 [Tulasnella sp. 424]